MSSSDTLWMLRDVITGIFEHRVDRWQGIHGADGKATDRRALLVLLRIKDKHIRMLIHAPHNCVGVYIQKEGKKEKWNCVSYHDSCWKSDGVERFLFEHREEMRFSFMLPFNAEKIGTTIEHVTDAILIIALTEEQIKEFRQIRDKKYN